MQTIDLPTPKAAGVLVYVVHGLNLAGQKAQGDGGTAVTVCLDGVPTLLPVELDVTTDDACFNGAGSTTQGTMPIVPNTATLGAVHAANAGPVELVIDGTTAASTLPFGESLFAAVPPDTYEVAVKLDGTPIVGLDDLTLADCTLTVVYVVGNQPIDQAPATVEPAPAAAAVTAAPAFTG